MKKSTLTAMIEMLVGQVKELTERLEMERQFATDMQEACQSAMADYHDAQEALQNTDELVRDLRLECDRLQNQKTGPQFDFHDLFVLLHAKDKPIERIKIIRQMTQCGLKEAKAFHDANLKGVTMPMVPLEPLSTAELIDAFENGVQS